MIRFVGVELYLIIQDCINENRSSIERKLIDLISNQLG